MPKPNYRPISYIKTSILWAFYYLKNDFEYEAAIEDMISKRGDTQANAAIVGGLLAASSGTKAFN